MSDYVVLYPCTYLCPTCSHALHRTGYCPGAPLPDTFRFKCLNKNCPEVHAVKVVPLQKVAVTTEVPDVCPD